MSNKRTYPQGDIHTPGYYLQHMNPGFPASSEIYCAQYPMPGIITSPYSSGVFSGGSHDSKSLSIPISAGSFLDSASTVEKVTNRCLVCAGTYGAKNNFEDWAAEHERGAEVEAAILAQEGHHCLLRPEYQFQNHEPNIGTPLLFENSNLSPFEASPTLSSESPGSDLNHEGFVILSIRQSQDIVIDYDHSPSTKRHKCSNADCSYTSSRRDHVNDHYRAHHLHMPYKCDAW